MKTFIKSIFVAAIASSFLLSSCGKFEEGPKISFRSAKSRLCGDWEIKSVTSSGVDVTSMFAGVTLDIEKDGGYKFSQGSSTAEGKWELGEDKDDVFFTPNDTSSIKMSYRILKLKNKEMKLRYTNSNGGYDIYEYKQ